MKSKIHWGAINSQVRLKAKINKTSVEFSDNHFQSRTKEKNALAISSNQQSDSPTIGASSIAPESFIISTCFPFA